MTAVTQRARRAVSATCTADEIAQTHGQIVCFVVVVASVLERAARSQAERRIRIGGKRIETWVGGIGATTDLKLIANAVSICIVVAFPSAIVVQRRVETQAIVKGRRRIEVASRHVHASGA